MPTCLALTLMPWGLGLLLSHPDHPCLAVNQARSRLVSLVSWQPPRPGHASCTSDTNWETKPCPEAEIGARFHIYESAAKTALPFVRQNRSAGTSKHQDKLDWKAPSCYLHRFNVYFHLSHRKKYTNTRTQCSDEAITDWDNYYQNNKHLLCSVFYCKDSG